MNYEIRYPKLVVDLAKVYENTKRLTGMAQERGIQITGVVKVTDSSSEVAKAMLAGGCCSIADSRMEGIALLREELPDAEIMLLRVPMLSEAENVVRYADVSLNSEIKVLEALNQAALNLKKRHRVVLMADLGDLREGFASAEELVNVARKIDQEMKGLFLVGVGVNLGCYGSIKPDVHNLGKLVRIAREVEQWIGRKLEIISGGASTSVPLLVDQKMPEGITHLRSGEAILTGKDLPDIWGYPMEGFHRDVAILQAEVIEVKDKPSHPIGEIFVDAFGGRPQYEDIGIRKRALLAVGKKDIGHHDALLPKRAGVRIVGSSSDHLIVDVTDAGEVQVGDVLEFELYYQALLYLSSSKSVEREFVHQEVYSGNYV